MGTNVVVAIKEKKGYKGIEIFMDGFITHTGKNLIMYFNSEEKVKTLLSYGSTASSVYPIARMLKNKNIKAKFEPNHYITFNKKEDVWDRENFGIIFVCYIWENSKWIYTDTCNKHNWKPLAKKRLTKLLYKIRDTKINLGEIHAENFGLDDYLRLQRAFRI